MKLMASSSPFTCWQIDGETVETVTDFIFLGSKITADGDCSHEIKRCLLLGRKAMTNLDSILKSWDIALPTKVHIVKAMVFPVVTYGCKSWTIMQINTATMENSVEISYKTGISCHMTQQSHFWAYTLRKTDLKETRAPQCSSQHCLQ